MMVRCRIRRSFVTSLLWIAFTGMGFGVALGWQASRHPTQLTGTDWGAFSLREKELYLSGFIAGAAAEHVRLLAGRDTADSTMMSSRRIEELRVSKQLPFPYVPSVYSAQLDDYYWWANHKETPIVDVMLTINRQMLAQ